MPLGHEELQLPDGALCAQAAPGWYLCDQSGEDVGEVAGKKLADMVTYVDQ